MSRLAISCLVFSGLLFGDLRPVSVACAEHRRLRSDFSSPRRARDATQRIRSSVRRETRQLAREPQRLQIRDTQYQNQLERGDQASRRRFESRVQSAERNFRSQVEQSTQRLRQIPARLAAQDERFQESLQRGDEQFQDAYERQVAADNRSLAAAVQASTRAIEQHRRRVGQRDAQYQQQADRADQRYKQRLATEVDQDQQQLEQAVEVMNRREATHRVRVAQQDERYKAAMDQADVLATVRYLQRARRDEEVFRSRVESETQQIQAEVDRPAQADASHQQRLETEDAQARRHALLEESGEASAASPVAPRRSGGILEGVFRWLSGSDRVDGAEPEEAIESVPGQVMVPAPPSLGATPARAEQTAGPKFTAPVLERMRADPSATPRNIRSLTTGLGLRPVREPAAGEP